MEDLARIVMVLFVLWIASGVALALLAWLTPRSWSRPLRLTTMGLAAIVFVLLTGALFGLKIGVVAGLPAALLVYHGMTRK